MPRPARGADRASAAADIGALSEREVLIAGAIGSTFTRAPTRPTLKRHNPKTVRKAVGESYHGCLRVDVLKGGDLYRKIGGWTEGVMADGAG
jgi:hypothetical protein